MIILLSPYLCTYPKLMECGVNGVNGTIAASPVGTVLVVGRDLVTIRLRPEAVKIALAVLQKSDDVKLK